MRTKTEVIDVWVKKMSIIGPPPLRVKEEAAVVGSDPLIPKGLLTTSKGKEY